MTSTLNSPVPDGKDTIESNSKRRCHVGTGQNLVCPVHIKKLKKKKPGLNQNSV